MIKLEKLMANPDRVREVIMEHMKDAHNIPAILVGGFCPSEFGMENHCSEDQNCEWCWSREVEEKMTVRTGGKWQLQRTPYESEIDIVSDGMVIATVEAGEGKEKVAQMMAAAPDMLEVLVEVKMGIDGYIPTCPLCGGSAERGHKHYCLWHVANAAIKKARCEE